VETGVEPEEVGVAAEYGGVGCVLEYIVVLWGLVVVMVVHHGIVHVGIDHVGVVHVGIADVGSVVGNGVGLFGGSDVDTVRGVFVHSLRMLDWV